MKLIDDRKQETKAVKDALRAIGMNPIKVTHGRGTAWGWMDVHISVPDLFHVTQEGRELKRSERAAADFPRCVDDCPACTAYRKIDAEALATIQRVTGRKGDYDGRINITQETV